MNPCPTCFRPLATEADEALALPEGSHLCWKEWGGVCEPPEWWESVTPLVVQTLRAEIDELRLTLAAEQGKPEGAPSEGWSFETMCLRDFWTKTYEDGSVATVQGDGSWMRGAFGSGSPAARGKADHQRAAMIAADNAINPPSPK